MRFPQDDDRDIRTLIERGSSSWVGPSPSAGQSRWAAEERPRRWVSLGRATAGFGIAALLTGSLALVATSRSPNDAAASVVRLVSHVFTTPPGSQPGVSPAPSPPASPAAPAGGAPTPSGTPAAGSRTPRPASPSPRGSQPPEDGYRSSPTPSPTGRTATPSPSPSPSRTPDE